MAWRSAPLLIAALALGLLLGCAPPARVDPPETHGVPAGAVGPQADLPALSPSSTLADYVRYGALSNPGLLAAFDAWRAALERVPQVTSLPEPRLTLGYYLRRVETRVGPQRFRVGISQMLPWPGKLRLAGAVAAAEAEAARERLEAARLALTYEITAAYCELYALAKAIAITGENVELLRYVEGVARARYRVATAQYPDVVRAQVELGKLQDQLQTLEEQQRPLAAQLNAALNRPPDAPLPLPSDLPRETARPDPAQLRALLREASPELKALRAQIQARAAAIDLARKSYYPDFTVGLSAIETGSARMRTSDSGKDAVVAEVGITLPIWRAKYRAAEREARLRHSSATHALAEQDNRLVARVERATFGLNDAERKISLYRDSLVPKAQQSLKATQAAYQAGKASLTDVIDAERTLLAFRLGHERALASRAQRLAELDMLVGRPVPRKPAKPKG